MRLNRHRAKILIPALVIVLAAPQLNALNVNIPPNLQEIGVRADLFQASFTSAAAQPSFFCAPLGNGMITIQTPDGDCKLSTTLNPQETQSLILPPECDKYPPGPQAGFSADNSVFVEDLPFGDKRFTQTVTAKLKLFGSADPFENSGAYIVSLTVPGVDPNFSYCMTDNWKKLRNVGWISTGTTEPGDCPGDFNPVTNACDVTQIDINEKFFTAKSVAFVYPCDSLKLLLKESPIDDVQGGRREPLTEPFVVKAISNGAPLAAQPITFSVTGPDIDAKLSSLFELTDSSGLAQTSLTLGSATGTYKVQASMPDSCGTHTVSFNVNQTETQKDATRLQEIFCDGNHFLGRTVKDALQVNTLNKNDGSPETGFDVSFEEVTFPDPAAQIVAPSTNTNNPGGIAKSDFVLGNAPGDYIVKARCNDCLEQQEVTCAVKAIEPPEVDFDSSLLGLFKRKRDVTILGTPQGGSQVPGGAPIQVYPQGINQTPTQATLEINTSSSTDFTAIVAGGSRTGGHSHDGNRPSGKIKLQGSGMPFSTSTFGTTDAQGRAFLTYESGEVAGFDIVLVRMQTGKEGDFVIQVKVPEIDSTVELPCSGENHTCASNTSDIHPGYRYGTPTLKNSIISAAALFRTSHNAIISLNDMSLINGGLMDICGDWTSTTVCKPGKSFVKGHVYHRDGTSVDINSTPRDPINPKLRKDVPDFLNKLTEAFNQVGCCRVIEPTIHFECPSNSRCQ